jgi:outer membrane protein
MTLTRRLPLSRAPGLKPLALALALGLAASAAQAQSLRELYEAARAYDATYLGARATAEATQYRADQAGALRLPTVGLQATSTYIDAKTGTRTVVPPSAAASAITSTTTTEARTTTNQVVLSAQQTLFNRANSATIDQADRGVAIALAQLRAAEQDLVVRVAQAYFDVLNAMDTLSTVQASKKAISEQLASAKRNFEVGTATITDTREAQARYDLALAQELAADNDLRVKRLALDQLVGRQNATPKSLAVPVTLPPLAPANVDDWISAADARSPTIQQAQFNLEVAQLETRKARAGHLPTLTLGANYAKTYPNGSADVTTTDPTGTGTANSRNLNSTSAGVALTLNVPIFAGFSIQNRVKETLSLEEKARNDLDVARRGITQGTRQAYFGVQTGRAQVKALEAAEQAGPRGHAAGLQGRRARQPGRAERPDPALHDPARPGQGPLRRDRRRPEAAPGHGPAPAGRPRGGGRTPGPVSAHPWEKFLYPRASWRGARRHRSGVIKRCVPPACARPVQIDDSSFPQRGDRPGSMPSPPTRPPGCAGR